MAARKKKTAKATSKARKTAAKKAPANRARSEFGEYKKRVGNHGTHGPAAGPTGFPGATAPRAMNPPPGWPGPPGAAGGPYGMGVPFAPGGYSWPNQGLAQAGSAESMAGKLGTSLRLGIEILNAGLAGGVRLLEGMAGPEFAHHGYDACSQSSCDCCQPHDCCDCMDCCSVFGARSCCTPKVGTCC